MNYLHKLIEDTAGKVLSQYGFSAADRKTRFGLDFYCDNIFVRFTADSLEDWLTIKLGRRYRVSGYSDDEWLEIPANFRAFVTCLKKNGVSFPEYELGVGIKEDLLAFCKLFPIVYLNLSGCLELVEKDAVLKYHGQLKLIK